jgi:rhamnosyltransferase
MDTLGVCAVIITFRPDAAVLENLAPVRPQVGGLVVVDNGSSSEVLAPFHAAAASLDFALIENGRNLGIAAALNEGVRWAWSQGFEYVALFDQDSTVTEGFIQAMLAEYESHPERDRVGIVTPVQVERRTGCKRATENAKDGAPLTAITSGSLIPIDVFAACGLFEDDLIIDCVDHEFCLRVRSFGFTIVESKSAVLLVAVGHHTVHHMYGIRIESTHHSAQRRYYMTRNRVVLVRRYWARHPGWSLGKLRAIVRETIALCLVEDERKRKLVNTIRGIHDAMRGRMWKVVEL